MSVQWNALMSAPNPGEAFANAYQQGIQQREQREMRQQAMQEHQEDREFRRTQMTQQAAMRQTEAHREKIIGGAKIFREAKRRNPNLPDEQVYASIMPILAQAGIDTSTLPPPGSPDVKQYLQGVLTLADAWAPEKEPAQPNIAKEVDYYRSIGRDDLAQQLLTRHAEGGPIVAANGDGTFQIIPRNVATKPSGPQPGAVVNGFRFRGGNPNDRNSWEPEGQGGPTQPASGGFPPAGY
jgi:hypothetical protein